MTYFDRPQVRRGLRERRVLFDSSAKYMVHASRREQPGMAEIHIKDADIVYVLDGDGDARHRRVGGGRQRDRRRTSTAGARIDGGETRTAAKGRRHHRACRCPSLVQGSDEALPVLRREGAGEDMGTAILLGLPH